MDDEPGRQLDDRINALVAKTLENSQAIDRLIGKVVTLADEVAAIRRQLPAERKDPRG